VPRLFLRFKPSRYIRGHRAREFQQRMFYSPFYRISTELRRERP
jgi:hypothetical protein